VRITTFRAGEAASSSGRGDAVESRHAYVHQDDVWLLAAHFVDGGTPVGCLADDAYGLVAGKDCPEAGAHEVVVVDEDDTYGRSAHSLASA
jgi:hypothetical protein